jgi:type IV pilus assembly protein PilZ
MSTVSRATPQDPLSAPRQHQRFEVDIPVDCSTRQIFVSNHVSNISKGGLFIPSPNPLPLDAEVSLVLRLPGHARPILARGRVVWNYDIRRGTTQIVPGSGIKFIEIPAGDRALLEQYLERLKPTGGQ